MKPENTPIHIQPQEGMTTMKMKPTTQLSLLMATLAHREKALGIATVDDMLMMMMMMMMMMTFMMMMTNWRGGCNTVFVRRDLLGNSQHNRKPQVGGCTRSRCFFGAGGRGRPLLLTVALLLLLRRRR